MKITEILHEGRRIPSSRDVMQYRPQLAAAAQQVYDAWEQDAEGQDEELGAGGICHLIADSFSDVLYRFGVRDILSINFSIGTNHVAIYARLADGIFEIDIAPHVYERGGGYTWTKIPDVRFQPEDVSVSFIDNPMKPRQFQDKYGDSY
jgi:hypothetical protein